MSWLNNSLNTIKGQLTNFAQEVLADTEDVDRNNPIEALTESEKKLEELNFVRNEQENEIAALRRQIAELQNKQGGDVGRSSKSPIEKHGSLEDSWFWPDNIPSSDASCKNDNEATSESSIGGDMITIPLDAPTHESDSNEKLHIRPTTSSSDDDHPNNNHKLKKLKNENASLNDKVKELVAENRQLNISLEELDSQHNVAMQEVLELKNQWQKKCGILDLDLKDLKGKHDAETTKSIKMEKDMNDLQKQFNTMQEAYALYVQENEALKNKLEHVGATIESFEEENQEIKSRYEYKDKELRILIETLTADKEFLQRENADLQNQVTGNQNDDALEAKWQIKYADLAVEKDQIQSSYVALQDETSDLQFDIEKFRTDLGNKIDALEKKVSDLTEQNQSLDQEIDQLRQGSINQIVDDWKQKYDNVKVEKDQIQNDFVMLEGGFDDLQTEVTDLKSKNQSLTDEVQVLKSQSSSGDENDTWKDKYDDLIKEKDKINQEFVRVRDELARVQQEHENLQDEMQTKVDSLQKEKTVLTTNNQCLVGEIKVLQRYSPPMSEAIKSSSSFEEEHFAWQQKYDEIVIEKDKVEAELKATNELYLNLQKERDSLNDELESKIEELKDEVQHLTSNNLSLLEEINELETKSDNVDDEKLNLVATEKEKLEEKLKQFQTELESKEFEFNEAILELQSKQHELENFTNLHQVLCKENEEYKTEVAELSDKVSKYEEIASDVESKLMLENVDLQKKLMDLESSIQLGTTSYAVKDDFINFEYIKEIFSAYLQIELKSLDKSYLETKLETIQDRIRHVNNFEKNLKDMSEEISHLIKEKSDVEQERNNIEADCKHYKMECSELMKNNEILLNELENYKCNKLETIPEHNEESIVILEKQLEECSNLNKTLEDEYIELNRRIDENELDKQEFQIKINGLQDVNKDLNNTIKGLHAQIELLEGEKCNLIFEINEMKTDDKKSAMESEIQEYKNKNISLESQLDRLSKDHADLVASMQTLQVSHLENKKESDATISRLEKDLREMRFTVEEKTKSCHQLGIKLEELKNNVTEASHAKISEENIQYQKLIQEKMVLDEQITKILDERNEQDVKYNNLQEKHTLLEKSLQAEKLVILQQNEKIQDFEKNLLNNIGTEEIAVLKKTIEAMTHEKNDLISSVTSKHNENIQYYMEIQRLNQLLQAELEKAKMFSQSCENCSKLQEDITVLQATNFNDVEKLKDQINFLREKSDILTSNLLSEQTNQKLLQQEKSEVVEQNSILVKDLERLRQHLVEIEEGHTQDTLDLEKAYEEAKAKINGLEGEMSKSSNAYTSASIRANQHAETLQAQYSLLTQQRDELILKLNQAEDRESKNHAALVNLQCALEQFQKEKDNDVLSATHRIRKELETEKQKQIQTSTEITKLQQKLSEANQGLLAAARLSDQLEISQVTIAALKEEIEDLQNKNSILDDKLKKVQSSQEDKVEKCLVKSLLIGYIVSTNQNDKTQILKLITSVLDFDQSESERIGLNRTQGGWLSGILYGGNNTNTSSQNDSLIQAFVNFLDKESQPRTSASGMPNLLNIVNENTATNTSNERKISISSSNSLSGTPTATMSINQPISLNDNVLEQFAPTRNSSSILKDILNDS